MNTDASTNLSTKTFFRVSRAIALGLCAVLVCGAQSCSTTGTTDRAATQPVVSVPPPAPARKSPAELAAEKRRAAGLIERKQYRQAAAILEAVVRDASSDVEAFEMLGRARRLSGQMRAAEKAYFSAYRLAPPEREADIAIPLGRTYMALNELAPAASFLEEGVDKHFDDDTLYDDLGKIYHKMRVSARWIEVVSMAATLRNMDKPRTFRPVGQIRADGIRQLIRHHYASAFFTLLQSAERGDAESQYLLGRMYHQGLGTKASAGGVRKNLKQARYWYDQAARQGHKGAQTGVGYMYLRGLGGVHRNEALAARWFTRAADQNEPGAMARLGLMYEKGVGVRRDTKKASYYLVTAAHAGDATARKRLTELRSWPLRGRAAKTARPEIRGGIGELPPLMVMTETGLVAITDAGPAPTAAERKADAKTGKAGKRRKRRCSGLMALECAF